MGWDLEFRNIEIWGTVISIIIPRSELHPAGFDAACDAALNYYQSIDEKFSTYKESSEVSALRSGALEISDASPEMKFVWNRCMELREMTQRAFDPWEVSGGFDPSEIGRAHV